MKSCKSPDPNPIKPREILPPGACDAHCHVFGPGSIFPYGPNRKYTPEDAPFEKLMALHDWLGISRAVIVQASCHGTDNRAMLDAIARSEGRYLGVAMVNGDESDAELERLHTGGVRGVRFNFVQHLGGAPDLPRFFSVLHRVKDLGWHVVLHLDAQDIVTYSDVISKIDIPFIIDHMGRAKTASGLEQKPFQQLLHLMRDNPFAWVKVSGSERISAGVRPFNDAIPFARALIETAPDRVLWGTDWPHPNISNDMPNDGELVNLMLDFCEDEHMRRKLLVENPVRLYGFAPVEA
ncbi:TPA: amidohydrolase family protein [Citrobacter farmeri]|uniref:Amidohydrolase family protein n=2 Tax=Citrobacter farmeri TaxID=67824 RepID=A0A8H9TUL3_9ENTR|nr:amidohydrolase family protein [Citrobacter farmeri]HAT2169294.1 amidohydrolase family protein [Citrobacter freundii]AST78094.1 2-pyrone-4,6-dicarboxylate hydrolase [Citrobacter farmeri]EKV7299384.1 amidohydrolase family protein [Citrobacter farmeri]EMB4693206.1 amidohydrolase family protein [Citrobacter farmeri]MBJ8746654.1 amidohydrolase family protein [Citrobacter farmeri]